MKSFLSLICLLFAASFSFAQGQVEITGTAKTEGVTPVNLSQTEQAKVLVTVYSADEIIEQFYTDKEGKFSYVLLAGNEYKMTFSKSGYLEKHLIYDLVNVPESEDSYAVSTNLTLFKNDANTAMQEFSYIPAAKCSFDENRAEILWDKKYAQQMNEKYYNLAME